MNADLTVLAVASSVVFAVSGVALWVKPPRRLASRVRPYANATRMEFGPAPTTRAGWIRYERLAKARFAAC